MLIVQTDRLALRTIGESDAPFYLNLINTREFIDNIGQRGIGTLAAAREAIRAGPVAMQAALGHSIYLVELTDSGVAIGMCGLIKRAGLDDVDLGYAFLPAYFGKGYGHEAAAAIVAHARDALHMDRLVAITAPGNVASIALLTKLGMQFEKCVHLPAYDNETRLYGLDLRRK